MLAFYGAYLLVTPDSYITRLFRVQISDQDARIVTGPYPMEDDFKALKRGGVTTIVSLLDPRIPYERVLIQRERALAKAYGVELLEFPMASILGVQLSSDRDLSAIAEALKTRPGGKVYLHCYLGIHRTGRVTAFLRLQGIETGAYALRRGERTETASLLDRAQAAFDRHDYRQVVAVLDAASPGDPRAAMLLGWTRYRLGDIAAAEQAFLRASRLAPDLIDARNGQAYCAMRGGRLRSAEQQFLEVLRRSPTNATARDGLAQLRRMAQAPGAT